MPVMMRGHVVCQLCVGRNSETNNGTNPLLVMNFTGGGSSDCNGFFVLLVVYYLSEVFKACLESFLSYVGESHHLGS